MPMVTESTITPIIRTKLYRPVVTAHLVCRERLHAELERGRLLPLTLVSAPAGYGKSTLISQWLETCSTPCAWLSVDESDNDLRTFLGYLVAAIRTVDPQACHDTASYLARSELPSPAVLSVSLGNDLDAIATPLVLVLDDYHVIHEGVIHELLTSLLKHTPKSIHLIIIARRNPPLPLSSLRARRQLNEIRTQDLQFQIEETSALIQLAASDRVSSDALSHVQRITEGWAVGLHLVALSIRGKPDANSYLCAMRGDIRHIQDYLVAEVLARQAPRFKECLLRAAVLDRFCSRLCGAILDCQSCTLDCSATEFIEWLDDTELFLVRLDDRHEWFRYHHLFQDLLQRQLLQLVGETGVAALHIRASAWFEGEGLLEEALHHAFEAGDPVLAGQIIARRRRDILDREQWHRLERWLGCLPSELVESDSELLLIKAWLLENRHRVEEIWPVLDRAEATLTGSQISADVADRINGEIHAIRSRQPYEIGDGQLTVQHAERALRLLPRDFRSERGYALVMLATGHQMCGNFAEAQSLILEALSSEEASNAHFHGRMLITLSFLYWMAADLPALKRTSARLLQLGEEHKLPESTGFGRYFLGIAHYQHNELAKVEEVMAPLVLDRAIARTNDFVNSSFVMASMCEALGRREEARGIVDCVVELMLEKRHPVLLPVAEAYQADLALRQGRFSQAARWAQNFDPKPLTAMYLAYVPAFTLAKVLLAENTDKSLLRVDPLLSRLENFVSKTHNRRFEIDVHTLQAMMHQQQGHECRAREELTKAVRLAQPGGFVRAFADFGPGVARLLKQLELDDEGLRYVGQVLSAIKSETASESATPRASTIESSLASPLSKRELEVLGLLAQRLSNKEIADELHISPQTVKRHANTIYEKLDVHNRREAAAKAASLGVLPQN